MNIAEQLTDHPTLQRSYREDLAELLLAELKGGPADLEALVKNAAGAYPTDVVSVLKWLHSENQLSESGGLWYLFGLAPSPVQTPPKPNLPTKRANGLPEPHPLDFDWRFADNALTYLRTRLNPTATGSGAILGAPTLYKFLIDSGANVWLYDRNHQIIERLRHTGHASMTETDLLRSLEFDPQFQWAVADPPWYEEHYEGFISAASRLILPAGRLFLSVLPRLTRPSAASDRFRIIEIAMNFGFDLVEINPSVLEYESPRFEIEALRTEGVFIEDWRKGDLFTFVLSSHVRVASDHLRSKNQDEWTTIQLGVTTIRIKQDQADTFSYRPASPSGDPRLHSVSRRSAVRSEINLWSSRNIALVVSKSAILAEALTAISEGTSPIETVKRVARTYQISEVEKETLREVLQLLIQDAGLSWKD